MSRLGKLGLELRLMSSSHRAGFLWTLPWVVMLTKHGVRTTLPLQEASSVLRRTVCLQSGITDPLPLLQTQTRAAEVEKERNVTLLRKVH